MRDRIEKILQSEHVTYEDAKFIISQYILDIKDIKLEPSAFNLTTPFSGTKAEMHIQRQFVQLDIMVRVAQSHFISKYQIEDSEVLTKEFNSRNKGV